MISALPFATGLALSVLGLGCALLAATTLARAEAPVPARVPTLLSVAASLIVLSVIVRATAAAVVA